MVCDYKMDCKGKFFVGKRLVWFSLFFVVVILVMQAVSAECIVGDVNGTHYCDVSGDWKVLKVDGEGCLNDYECESGTCSSDGTCGSEYSGLGGGDESQENILEKIWNELGCILLKPFNKRKYCSCLYESNLTEYCNCLVKEGVELTSEEVFSCGFNNCTPNNRTCDQTVEGVNSGCGIWCNGTKLVAICGANGSWDYSLSGYVEGYCGYSPSEQECTPGGLMCDETQQLINSSCGIWCKGQALVATCSGDGTWKCKVKEGKEGCIGEVLLDGFCGYHVDTGNCTPGGGDCSWDPFKQLSSDYEECGAICNGTFLLYICSDENMRWEEERKYRLGYCGYSPSEQECTPGGLMCDETQQLINSSCGIWCNGTKLMAICGANGSWDYSLSGYVEGYCGYSPSEQECTPYDEEHNETCYENEQVTSNCSVLCDGIKLKALCNNSGFWDYYNPPTATDGFCGYSSNPTCTDDGKAYDQFSNCHNGSNYSDSCINRTYLKEYYCGGDSGSECLFEVHFCGEGYKCENGACIVNESGEDCDDVGNFKCVDKNLLVCTLQKKWKSLGKVSGYCENPAKGYIEFGNVTSSSYIPQNESILQFIEKIEGLAAGEVGKIYLQISKNPDDFSDSFSTPSNSENFSLFYLAKIELDAESSGKIYFKVNSSEIENSSNVRSYVWEKADNLWNSLSIEFLGNSSGYSRFKVNTSHFSVFLIGEGRVDEECIPEWNCTEWSDPVHHCGFRECYAIRTCGEPPPAEFKDCDTDTGYCGDGICDPDYELCGDSDDPPECKSDCGRCEPQGSGSVCGNGKCEVGETTSNCPEDCKFTSGETKANGGRIPLLPKGEGKSTWAIVLAIVLILAGIGVITFIILQRIKEQRKALMKSKGDSKSDKEGRGSAVGGGSTSGKPPGSSGGASERGKVLTRPQSFSNFPQRNV